MKTLKLIAAAIAVAVIAFVVLVAIIGSPVWERLG